MNLGSRFCCLLLLLLACTLPSFSDGKNHASPTGKSGPVASLDVLSSTSYSITVQWTSPSLPNGQILWYQINVTSDGKPEKVINVTCDQPNDEGGKKHNCEPVNTFNTKSVPAVSQHGNEKYDYNITGLQPFTNYTVAISCVNINGTGEENSTTVQTNTAVPSPPKELKAFGNSSSSVILFWSPADHQDGPTTYYITLREATHLNLDNFEEKEIVTVDGFYYTSVLIEDLRSYWKYTFNITAATPVGNSSVVSLNGTVRTKESAPGKVENLHIDQIPDNLTSVEVFFSCPKETERHGDIKYYILSYDAQVEYNHNVTENHQRLNISAQHESNCNYSRIVPVKADVNYIFSVVAHDSYAGNETTEYHFAKVGQPGSVSDFTSTSTTSSSISLSWKPPRFPNGFILGYVLYVHTEDGACLQAVHIVCTDCQSHGTIRVGDEMCRISRHASGQRPETSLTNYNVTSLLSFTNYTITVAAVNNFSIGINVSLAIRTDIDVPAMPGNLFVTVLNASAVEVTWTPPVHKSGPTDYTILLQQATGRQSSTFENMENVTVNGYDSSERTIEGLLSSWRYMFSITARTAKGDSLPVVSGSYILTQESKPCEVQNLNVSSIPGNFTAVKLTWDCPKERQRNGFIKSYTIQYSGPGAVPMMYGHYEPEDQCDNTHTAILPVRPEHNYTFKVFANAAYQGNPRLSHVYNTVAGRPSLKPASDIFVSTNVLTSSTDMSVTVTFNVQLLTDTSNGEIIAAGILVLKNQGSTINEDLYSYVVGEESNCEKEPHIFCNGPLEPSTIYMVIGVACTQMGCSSTDMFGHFKTKELSHGADKDVTPWIIAFGVSIAILLCVIIILVLFFKVVQPAKTLRSRGEGNTLELAVRGEDGTGQREDTPYDEVACGSAGDNHNALATKEYQNVDIRKQETYESLTNQVDDQNMHLYDTVQARL